MSIPSRTTGTTGNAYFTQLVSAQLLRLRNQIPDNIRLNQSLLENPPLNVTSIPETILSEKEIAITNLNATELLKQIRQGELSTVDAVTAFGKRAAIAHQLTSCLTDFFLDEAIEQAKELDDYLKTHRKPKGPLHGLPISIKDHYPIKGRWGSAGMMSNLEKSPEDCYLVSILRDLGAVFYVKTNMPQAVVHLECQSFYGRTLNPYNLNLSPGGSSGGEAALLAMKGSCMGIGSDLAGSIRCPCAFSGLYGIRPTSSTFPTGDIIWYQKGNDGVVPSFGPMCRSAGDLEMLITAVQTTEPWLQDPSLLPIPLQVPDITQKKLRVGIMFHDGVVSPHPPLLRALRFAKEKLEASEEVEVVKYVPYKHGEGRHIAHLLYFDDGGETVRRGLREGGEDVHPLTEWTTSPPNSKILNAAEAWELHLKRDQFRYAYQQHWWGQNVDVLLCPAFGAVAPRHDTARYTAIWNLLDYPGAVFPTGLVVNPELDVVDPNFVSFGPEDSYNHAHYDPRLYTDAPIGLQVVAPRFKDGLVLAALKAIERIIKA